MIGQILTRLTSVLLLPFYTHQLTPADYGVVGILDLTCAILSVFVASGLISAVTRHHFDEDSDRKRDEVWWTGLTMVICVATVIATPMLVGRQLLSDLTLGVDVTEGAYFYLLAIGTMWFTVLGMVFDSYLRVMKWSGIFVGISMGRLLLNIGLNVWLIAGLNMGVEGLLVGNLIATVFHTSVLGVVFLKSRGAFSIDREIGRQMVQFAAPLVFTALATMLMHEADRYILNGWWDLETVGIYSLAHKIGFAVNTLCLLPFISIWHVAIYEIDQMEDSEKIFGKVFGYFVGGLGILLLGASLTVHPILPLLSPDEYDRSIDLISVVLLGFFVFGISFMFEVPSMLRRNTKLMIPGSIAGLVVNVAANLLLVPKFGAWGAAWAGVATYVAYSSIILAFCRREMKIAYSWTCLLVTTIGLSATYVVGRYVVFPHIGVISEVIFSVAVCLVWLVILFGKEGLDFLADQARNRILKKGPTSETDDGHSKDQAPAEEECELVGASS